MRHSSLLFSSGFIVTALLLPLSTLCHAADWNQFRGPDASGIATEADAPSLPLKIGWAADLPGRGLSSPIVVGDRAFVTCSSGPEQLSLHVICFNAKTGDQLWERVMRATGRTMSHNKTCVAAPTPCSDGERIFALFSSNDLFAFDLDGNLLWLRGLTYDYANASNSLGMSQSPTVIGDTLVVQSENDSESFAAGIDVKTGINRWKMDRPKAANWTSPVVWKSPSNDSVVALQSSKGLMGLDPTSGKSVWNYEDGASTIPSSIVGKSAIFAVSHGITALRPEGSSISQLWRNEKLNPGTASPLLIGDSLFVINNAGVLIKASMENGDEAWKLRLKGPISGSPVGAGHHLYIASERGDFQVIDTTTKEGEVVQTLELKETILCTPAVSGKAVFIRSDGKLWRLNG
jgi:outer membrane protein assembly factor BamB